MNNQLLKTLRSSGLALVIRTPEWTECLQNVAPLLERLVSRVRQEFALPKKARFSLLFTNDAEMQELNRDYRHKDKPTNVLSFPQMPSTGDFVGDIALGYETIVREAQEQGKPMEAHVLHLLLHGMLHLLGCDHETDLEADEMESLESALLNELGIDNPYQDGI